MTRCEGCGGVSGVESPFYELELNVQNCPTIYSSLEQFFKVLRLCVTVHLYGTDAAVQCMYSYYYMS